MSEVDMYSEPGHSTLRRMMKDEPEWAVNRLVAERARIAALEAENAELRRKVEWLTLDCDEYEFDIDEGRCHHAEDDRLCPKEPGCHDKDRLAAPSPDAKEATDAQ